MHSPQLTINDLDPRDYFRYVLKSVNLSVPELGMPSRDRLGIV
jgi:hypothetical protein